MVNKLIIGALALLVILSGAQGAYSYMLSQQLVAFQKEQIAQLGAISGELTTFRGQTINNVGILKEELDRTRTRVNTLQYEVKDVATDLSQSVMNATKIYERASRAVVRISNGERTVGSGFVIDTEGHVVTAYHVVEQLTRIDVILSDGSISKATVTGSGQFSDIAILTLKDKPEVEPLEIAESAELLVGEPVIAIGNPMDQTETLTSGIISKLNRFVEIEYDAQRRWVANLIQFDAAVNSGNSGGPLLNSEGQVIGLVVARIKPEDGDGIYYAVSSSKLQRVTTALINQGYFDYPWLGINVMNLTPQLVLGRDLGTINGTLVTKIATGSPAGAAGIKVNDIIVAIDGKPIRDIDDLTSYLGEHKSPGEDTTTTLIRDNTTLELSLKIGTRNSNITEPGG